MVRSVRRFRSVPLQHQHGTMQPFDLLRSRVNTGSEVPSQEEHPRDPREPIGTSAVVGRQRLAPTEDAEACSSFGTSGCGSPSCLQ